MDFWSWWQNWPLSFDGVLVSLGGFEVQYYGFMYLVALVIGLGLLRFRQKKGEMEVITEKKMLEDLIFGVMACVLIGGRLGYVLFYNLAYYLANPLEIVWPFVDGQFVGLSGMSFHGGLVLSLLYGYWFVKKYEINFWEASDEVIVVAPLAYFFGRIGNFLNSELYGRVTEVNWGMKFVGAGESLRHPSQLYQGFGEGLLVFVVMWMTRNNKKLQGLRLGLFLILFGALRFLFEFFRQPDDHLGLMLGLSRGQYLSLGMVLAGLIMMIYKSSFGESRKVS